MPFPPWLVAEARIYEASEIKVNPYGAVSVLAEYYGTGSVTEHGYLGIKPDEFEWVSAPVAADQEGM